MGLNEQKRRDGKQSPRFKATIQKRRVQNVQFSRRKQWVIVLTIFFFLPLQTSNNSYCTHINGKAGKRIPPPETH